jgi:arylsulfatase A-like enzyme
MNKMNRGRGFFGALVFALLFNTILWMIETLVFFAQKIANPRIWFYLSWKSLVLYLAVALAFFIVAFTASRISLRRKHGALRSDRVFLRGYLVLTLLAYFLSLYFIKFRPRLAPHWYHFASLAALLIVTAGTIGLAIILSGLIAVRIGPGRSLRVMRWIAILAIAFCVLNTAFDVNEMSIPRITQGKTTPGQNLVVILVDTLRPDFLGCYGNPNVRTPNIDRLAGEGILFRECVSQAPWTLPSLASFLTSKYPSQHGAERQRTLDKTTAKESKILLSGWLQNDNLTLFEILKENGYATAFFQPNITAASFLGFDQGVDFFFDAFKNKRLIWEDAVSALSKEKINDLLYPRYRYADNRRVIAYAKKWLKRNERVKYCLFVMLLDCHEYYLDVVGYKNRFLVSKDSHRDLLVKAYKDHVEKSDRDVGALISALSETNRFKRTMILLSADHGEGLFEHVPRSEGQVAFWDKGLYHGQTVYDEITKIPLIITLPEAAHRPREVSRQVRSIDVLPTLVSLLHIKSQGSFEGADLSRDDFQESDALPAFSESALEYPEIKSVRKGGWKLIYHPLSGAEELYDLRRDPMEGVNLAGQQSAAWDSLRRELFDWMARMDKEKIKNAESRKKRELTREEKDALKSLGYIR